jgi:hypothetical protein
MELLKRLGTGLCLTMVCLLVVSKTQADDQSSKTAVTFTVPVAVPGVGAQTLPAGIYTFKVLNSASDRDIIQISSQDDTHVFATMVGVPNARLKGSDQMVMMFGDRPAGEPQALKAWFNPSRASGDQIVYDLPMATQLAKETNETVLSTPMAPASSSVDTLNTASISAVSPSGATVDLAQVVDAPQVGTSLAAVAIAPASATDPAAATASTTTAVPADASAPTVAATTTTTTAPADATASTTTAVPADASAPTVAATTMTTTPPADATAPTAAAAPVAPVEPAVATEPAVAAAPVAATEPTVATEPAVAAEPAVAEHTLPQTASLLPLFGLCGLLMLGAGFLVAIVSKRQRTQR